MRITAIVTMSYMLSVMVLFVGCAQSQPSSAVMVLRNISVEYSGDGAGGCIPELVQEPQAKKLLRRPKIWQELIDSLDSTTSTNSMFEGQLVPLGFVCLDILLKSVGEDYWSVVFLDSADDGLWTNVRDTYYFPPDILMKPRGKSKMASVRHAWQMLYQKTNGRVWDISKHSLM